MTSLDPESKGVYRPTTLLDPEPEGTSHLRPFGIQNPKVHKSPVTSLGPEPDTQDKLLQGLSYSERSPRPTLPKQGMSRDFF
jgi:hypothetical protein